MTQGTDPRTGYFDRYPSYCRGTYDLLGRGTSGFYRSFPIVLPFLSPSVAADAIPFQTSRRHWRRLLRQRLQERSSSTRPLWLHANAGSFNVSVVTCKPMHCKGCVRQRVYNDVKSTVTRHTTTWHGFCVPRPRVSMVSQVLERNHDLRERCLALAETVR